MSKFELPARPWGDAEIKNLMAHRAELDEETLVELGLTPSEAAADEATEDDAAGDMGEQSAPDNEEEAGDAGGEESDSEEEESTDDKE